MKPSMFFGSSKESLVIARALRNQLQDDVNGSLWNERMFSPGDSFLESLIKASSTFDFAAIVFSGDDVIERGEITELAPRDNVLFEAGLFIGRIGRERTIIVADANKRPRIPTDFKGITFAEYRTPENGNWASALGPASDEIRERVKELGAISPISKKLAVLSNTRVFFRIHNLRSGKCLDVKYWGINNGDEIFLWTCNRGDNQLWYLEQIDERFFAIISKSSNKCLEVANDSLEDEAVIQQWDYHGQPNQQWMLTRVDDGSYKITARHSGKSLTAVDLKEGATLVQRDWEGRSPSKWWLQLDIDVY